MLCLLLAGLVFTAYFPVLGNGFVGYDDPDYVTANPHVSTGLNADNLRWALTAFQADNWHPLTWISHQADCSLFGLDAGLHHFTSLLLHVANTLLLFLWLSRVTGSMTRSAFVAAIFGVHPVGVESVAWVAERKAVLSALFGILTLAAYTAYARQPSAGRYASTLVLFAASLAAKQSLVALPLVMLALDFWPLQRKERPARLAREKLPLLALAAAASGAAFWAQRQGGALVNAQTLPIGMRLANAAVSYIRYLAKIVWPVNLSVFYPYAPVPNRAAAAGALVLGAVSVLAFRWRRGRPWLLTGWCWFVLTLLPVIGLVQVGVQSMADRYLYIPVIGLMIAAAWSFSGRAAAAGGAIAIALCAGMTWRQVHYWIDGETLFRHAIAVTENNYIAHDNLGVELDRQNRGEEALAEYREAVRIQPGDRHAEYNLAQALFAKGERRLREGKYGEARALFEEGLRHQPGSAAAHTYLGVLEAIGGDAAAALASFDTAIRLDPSYAPARAARAELMKQGH